jgi:hypothetical protein
MAIAQQQCLALSRYVLCVVQHICMYLIGLKYAQFRIFKHLRSTTEQMPALV